MMPTPNAVGSRVAQRARNLATTFEDKRRVVKFLIRDRDTKLVGPFDEVMTSIGSESS